jgi:hypothetical protein
MHMSPKRLDADGILSGKTVKAGDPIGLVANYNEYERGTTYHLHFDMQVPTRIGWVFVNPYMTLVASYEHLIGARGREIEDGDPAPAAVIVPPVILSRSAAQAAVPANVRSEAPAIVPLPEEKPRTSIVTEERTSKKKLRNAKIQKHKAHKRAAHRNPKRGHHTRKTAESDDLSE